MSERGVETELDQGHELIERLRFWRPAGKSAGQIVSAVLQRKTLMQDVHLRHEVGLEFADRWIGAEGFAGWTGRYRIHDRAGDGERPRPGQPIGQVAESLAEEDARLNGVGLVGADRWRSRLADAPGHTHRHQGLVPVVAVGFVFEADIGGVES